MSTKQYKCRGGDLHMEVGGPLVCCVVPSLDGHVHSLQRWLSGVCQVIMGGRTPATHADAAEDADQHLSGLDDWHEGGNKGGADTPDHGQDNPEDEVACTINKCLGLI